MRKFFMMTLLACLAGTSWAQKDAEAKKILDKAAAAFQKAGGVEIGFTVEGSQALKGTLQLKGPHFALQTSTTSTWYDGKTQWTYMPSTNEVNISNPSPDQVQRLNPQSWLNSYKQGFNYKYNGTSGTNYQITLTPEKANNQLKSVVLLLNTTTYAPSQIVINQANGQSATIKVSSYRTGQNYNESTFRFDSKKYPNAEVIDLR